MPFWSTFFRTLGFEVCMSDASIRGMYESGLSVVTSDTVCSPAKLVHGHLRNLASRPYQNDALVNHDLPEMFTAIGIPVLTTDALSQTCEVNSSKSRLDIVNNYHTTNELFNLAHDLTDSIAKAHPLYQPACPTMWWAGALPRP